MHQLSVLLVLAPTSSVARTVEHFSLNVWAPERQKEHTQSDA